MPVGSRALTLPLGPSTRTVLPFSLTVYLTPAGRAIGFLPIRDITNPFSGLRVAIASRADRSRAADKTFCLVIEDNESYFRTTTLPRGSRRQHLLDAPGDQS